MEVTEKVQLKPVNNYVALKMLEGLNSPLALPSTATPQPRWGEVLEVGEGVPDLFGVKVPPPLKPGDLVYIMHHGLEQVDFAVLGFGGNVSVVSELDILAVLEEKMENTVKIQPLGSYVQIEKLDPAEKSSGGIYLPDTKKVPPNVGIVKRVGKGWRAADGSKIEMQVKEGDKVAFLPFNTLVIDLNPIGIDEKLYLVAHGDILGVIE